MTHTHIVVLTQKLFQDTHDGFLEQSEDSDTLAEKLAQGFVWTFWMSEA